MSDMFTIIQYKKNQKSYLLIVNNVSKIKTINQVFKNKKGFCYFQLLK